jgi:hypothetical protein
MSTAHRLAREAQAVFEAADRQGRSLTADERIHVESLLDRAQEAKGFATRLSNLGAVDLHTFDNYWDGASTDTPGAAFVRSDGYQRIKNAESRPQNWSSGLVEVSTIPLSAKGTLLEGAGAPGLGHRRRTRPRPAGRRRDRRQAVRAAAVRELDP